MSKTALYLAGGGARGAYQAGVVKALAELIGSKQLPFHTISGVSVGSINATMLANHADDFQVGTEKLCNLWANIHSEKIFNASNYQVSKSVLRNVSNLFVTHHESGYLLDTSPLKDFINHHMDFKHLAKLIEEGHLHALELISHCYESQQTVSFYQHHNPDFEDWQYPRHISKKETLQAEHILASSALPLFFPTVNLNGYHYGDGSMGLISPLRGAIRFDVSKVLIIGTRSAATMRDAAHTLRHTDIGFARILGGMLNGLFMDNLDRDIEMVNRMNDIAKLISLWKKRRSPWRPIETLHLKPSVDIATLAQAQYSTMPGLLRFMLNVLGAKSHSGDLLSFLLFEKEFAKTLLDLGYEDTLSMETPIKAFFEI